MKQFLFGQWQQSPAPLSRDVRKALATLYQYRLKADYHGRKVTAQEARGALATAEQVLRLVAVAYALPQRGLNR